MCNTCKQPPPLDSPEVARKKLFWKLAYAQATFGECRKMANYFLSEVRDDSHTLYDSLVCSICVAYARAFTHGADVGQLPNRFHRLPWPAFQKAHSDLIRSRHQIYAHKDATVIMHGVKIVATYDGSVINYGLKISMPKLRGLIFPDIVGLCEYQEWRTAEEIAGLCPEVLPIPTAFRIMKASRCNGIEFPIQWGNMVNALELNEIISGL